MNKINCQRFCNTLIDNLFIIHSLSVCKLDNTEKKNE